MLVNFNISIYFTLSLFLFTYFLFIVPGTFDQSYIPHAIAYSACLGEHRLRCQGLDHYVPSSVQNCSNSEATSNSVGGQPVAVASSVMADDGHRVKSKGFNHVPGELVLIAIITIKVAII